jgi:hypothetical protein
MNLSHSAAVVQEFVYYWEILLPSLLPGVIMASILHFKGEMLAISGMQFVFQLVHQARRHQLIPLSLDKQHWNDDVLHLDNRAIAAEGHQPHQPF